MAHYSIPESIQAVLPKSVLSPVDQVVKHVREYSEGGTEYRLVVKLKYGDSCHSGRNSFSITADLYSYMPSGRLREEAGGCLHDEIAKHFPELAHLIKWHLTSTDGPMYYLQNATYLAGDRDCWGLRKGEKRQLKNGKTGLPVWHLVALDAEDNEIPLYKLRDSVDVVEQPHCPYRLEYRPWWTVGEGKEREFDKARSVAVWPEATDAQLSAEPPELVAMLLARLPSLMDAFYKDMLELDFVY